MRLGIDLGTTRTVVAASDRGNYPVVGFRTVDGDLVDFVPTVSAVSEGVLLHGHAALAAAQAGAPFLRSWKRLLGRHGPEHRVSIGPRELTLLELTHDFLASLLRELQSGSNAPGDVTDTPAVVVSVPANAHSSQRFTTLEAFRRAGFDVKAMINESSAAGIEYAHRFRTSLNSKRDHVAVYDLGGGTFDAALVVLAQGHHDVVRTCGIRELGGDDFDAALLQLALQQLGLDPEALDAHTRLELMDECRCAKEAIGPNTRKLVLDLAALGDDAPTAPVILNVSDLYDRVRSLVDQTVVSLAEVMATDSFVDGAALKDLATEARVAGVYVVGGASGLPIVTRQLREQLGRRVHRSPHASASIAIGLAIAGDAEPGAMLTERFTRHLGVFRERNHGAAIAFDNIFAMGTAMPQSQDQPLCAQRRYRAAHNLGVLRFVECADLADGRPTGDISPHATIYFPFAPGLRERPLHEVAVERLDGPGPIIEESYRVDASGVVSVTIRDRQDGFNRTYVL